MGERIDRLLVDLTLAEKVALMGGRDLWSVQPVEMPPSCALEA